MPSILGLGKALSNLGSDFRQNAGTLRAQQEQALERAFRERQFQAQQDQQAQQNAIQQQQLDIQKQREAEDIKRYLNEQVEKGVLRSQPGQPMDPALAAQAQGNPALMSLVNQSLPATQQGGMSTLPQAPPNGMMEDPTMGPTQPEVGMMAPSRQTGGQAMRVPTWQEAQADQERQREQMKFDREQADLKDYHGALNSVSPEQRNSVILKTDLSKPGWRQQFDLESAQRMKELGVQGANAEKLAHIRADEGTNNSPRLMLAEHRRALEAEGQMAMKLYQEGGGQEYLDRAGEISLLLKDLRAKEYELMLGDKFGPAPTIPTDNRTLMDKRMGMPKGMSQSSAAPPTSPQSRAQQLINEALRSKK